MEKILRKEKVRFYCVHCKKEVENVWFCKMDSIFGTRYVLLCTGCQKLIGIYSSIDIIEQINISDTFFNELQIQLN